MGFIYAVLIVFEALLSALLIAIIFMQKTKGGMGGSAFGGGAGEAIFGSRMGNVLTKATVVLGTIFLLNTILLTILTARRGDRGGSVMDRAETLPMPVQQPMLPASLPEAGTPPAGAGESAGQGGFPMQAAPVEMPDTAIPVTIPAVAEPPVATPEAEPAVQP